MATLSMCLNSLRTHHLDKYSMVSECGSKIRLSDDTFEGN